MQSGALSHWLDRCPPAHPSGSLQSSPGAWHWREVCAHLPHSTCGLEIVANGKKALNMATYDYLALAGSPEIMVRGTCT